MTAGPCSLTGICLPLAGAFALLQSATGQYLPIVTFRSSPGSRLFTWWIRRSALSPPVSDIARAGRCLSGQAAAAAQEHRTQYGKTDKRGG
jgi:hypothetical protein